MKTLIVPTDYSENARNATEYAAALAKQTNAKLILFHSYDSPLVVTEVPMMNTSIYDDLVAYHTRQLTELKENLISKYTIRVEYALKMGSILYELPRFFQKQKADLVVIGLRGSNPLTRFLMGSVTASLLKAANIPVLVVPRDFVFNPIRHILFACDFKPLQKTQTIAPLKDIAQAFRAKIEVLHLPQPQVAGGEAETSADELFWEKQLRDYEHSYMITHEDTVQEAIDRNATESGSDLLVMIPHHHNFFEKLLEKSNTHQMAFHTRLPLLALPDDGK